MELVKFSNQLGGKDPTQPPFRIPAKDLDSNFAKLRPLPTDGNARQYAVEETPDGWFLRLFPDTNGVVGEVEEAPEDGKVYGRQDAAWVEAFAEAPKDTKTYGRKDGAWTSLVLVPAPPTTGVRVLGSIAGVLTWLTTEDCA